MASNNYADKDFVGVDPFGYVHYAPMKEPHPQCEGTHNSAGDPYPSPQLLPVCRPCHCDALRHWDEHHGKGGR